MGVLGAATRRSGVPGQPDGRGGYVLVRLAGRDKPVMLHHNDMSDELRRDLSEGAVSKDDEIYVEVVRVDHATGRVNVKDTEEPPSVSAA